MNSKKYAFRIVAILMLILILFGVFSNLSMGSTNNLKSNANEYNYAEALQLALYFYDANKCGTGIENGALTWRGDCHTYDEHISLDTSHTNLPQEFIDKYKSILDPDGDMKIDVSGGFHDAGDHIKCAQTAGFSLSTLNWGIYEFKEAYEKTGNTNHAVAIIKRFCDYIIKCSYVDANGEIIAFCYQVGDDTDHNYWEAPEVQNINRPAFFAYSGNCGTEQAMQCAAGLASSAVVLKDIDSQYASKCLEYAEALYNFGMKYKGSTPNHNGYFYASTNGYDDDIAWANVWMYIATQKSQYIEAAKQANINDGWIHCWDKVWGGYTALMADVTKDAKYISLLEQNINNLANSNKTQNGFIVIGDWGTARNNTAWQMYALTYSKATGDNKYIDEVEKQMQYILGNNPMNRSYLIGYSSNYAKNPHHRASSGLSYSNMQSEHAHVLYGALVGGPDKNDYHVDSTNDYKYNEVALDYNAPFMGALAGLYVLRGMDNGNKPVKITADEINANYYDNGNIDNPINPNKVTIKEYRVDETNKYIYRIQKDTTANMLLSNIIGANSCKIYTNSNKEIKENEVISTNMKILINDEVYTLIVIGDIDGNGKISITDLVKLNLFSVNLLIPNKIEKIAGDINGDERITITDLVRLNLNVVGLLKQ